MLPCLPRVLSDSCYLATAVNLLYIRTPRSDHLSLAISMASFFHSQEADSLTELTLRPPGRRRSSNNHHHSAAAESTSYVKVSMDGTPYLRKLDLASYGDYAELLDALNLLFHCSSIGSVLGDERSCSVWEHAVAYQDKDGDWMLLGDVPWGMFLSSCRRMRIMRASDARGISMDR